MATVEECDAAFRELADRLTGTDPSKRSDLDRTLSCTITDLGVVFAGHLHDGKLTDIRQVTDPKDAKAQVNLAMSGDELLDLVAGRSKFPNAWATGRIKVDARVMDLVKLRSVF
jgi:hypothetical protein